MSATVKVSLPRVLLELFEPASGARDVEVAARDVAGVLDALDERWPGMRDRLRDSSPAIRRHVAIYVDGRQATLATAVADGAEVFVTTRISGG